MHTTVVREAPATEKSAFGPLLLTAKSTLSSGQQVDLPPFDAGSDARNIEPMSLLFARTSAAKTQQRCEPAKAGWITGYSFERVAYGPYQ